MLKNVQLLKLLPFVAIALFAAILLTIIPLSSDAHAASKCGGEDTAVITCANNENGVWGLLLLIIGIMSAGVGVLAVAGIVYASVLWTTAEDKPDQVTKAKGILTNTIVGIVAFALMWSGLQFIVPGGVFNRDFDFSGVDSSKSKLPGTEENAANGETAKSAGSKDKSKTTENAAKACYWKPKAKQPGGDLYHITGSTPYAFENSPKGVNYAADHGYEMIDIDLQVTKDGVIVAAHTVDPLRSDSIYGGFKDPTGAIKNKKRTISSMTWKQVSRLEHKDGYKIHKVDDIISAAKSAGIHLFFELKESSQWKAKLPELAAIVNSNKANASIAIQSNKTNWKSTLGYASRLGFWTRNITAGTWTTPKTDAALCKKLKA